MGVRAAVNEINEPSTPDVLEGVDVDTLLSDDYGVDQNRVWPMDDLPTEPKETAGEDGGQKGEGDGPVPVSEPGKPASEGGEFLEVNGQKVEVTPERKNQLAIHGYQLEQAQAKIAQERASLETEKSQWAEKLDSITETQEMLSKFQEIDNFIRSGEEGQAWWEWVQNAYQNRGAEGLETEPQNKILLNRIQQLEQRLGEYGETINGTRGTLEEMQNRFKIQDEQTADEALNESIKDFKEQHPGLKWDELDNDGKSVLEQKIINHAVENSISSFRAAALDLLADDILKQREMDAEARAADKLKKQTRRGVVNAKASNTLPDIPITRKTDRDLLDEAFSELGI